MCVELAKAGNTLCKQAREHCHLVELNNCHLVELNNGTKQWNRDVALVSSFAPLASAE